MLGAVAVGGVGFAVAGPSRIKNQQAGFTHPAILMHTICDFRGVLPSAAVGEGAGHGYERRSGRLVSGQAGAAWV